MISLNNVTKYYPMRDGERHYVLRNVSLDIPSHRSIAILGPNGAGKSTLLRLIGGAEAPNEGSITTVANISWPIGLSSGFQGSMTGRQNINFACQINGLSKAETQQVIDDILDFSELGEYFDMPIKSYSSGMRARLGFGLSINFDFDYYLIDELTAVGDIIFKEKAKKEFKKISEKSSLIFASHSLNSLRESCQSAIFLHDGNLEYFEGVEEGIRAYESYIGKESKTDIRNLKKKAVRKKAKKATRNTTRNAAKKAARKTIRRAIKRATKRAAKNNPNNKNEK